MAAGTSDGDPAGRFGSQGAGDDSALLARSAAGDLAAFRTLVNRHLRIVLAVSRRMLRDEAAAEDVAQETMLKLWRSGGKVEVGAGGLKPWLRRVASNLCIDRIRAGRREEVVDEVPEVIEPARQLEALEERDVASKVDAALAALPARQRQALVLFHYEGMSQAEVGTALGISDEAVESLLARARRTLKSTLAEEWRALHGGD